MLRRIFFVVMPILLVTSMLTLAFNIQPVKANGIIVILADGSIDPPTAPISTVDASTYTFTGDIINDSIVVQRDNIVLDGAGFTVQGDGTGNGIDLSNRYNITIKNTNIKNYWYGIYLNSSLGNSFSGNNITANGGCGIYLYGSSDYNGSNYNSISGNNITDNADGIWLCSSLRNSISGNDITNNQYGIYLCNFSYLNSISGNNVVNNVFGIYLYSSSSYNSISGNNITASKFHGIWLSNSSRNSISGNDITNNGDFLPPGDGIFLVFSSDNTISGNNITSNGYGGGIHLQESSDNNSISGNSVTASIFFGIMLYYSSGNSISGNNITANDGYGIDLPSASGNSIFHNNFINNAEQVYSENSVNVWDDGYPSGGNYWSNYTGVDLYNGLFQNETGSDGIGDSSYIIDANNTDQYPLMTPYIGADIAATNVSFSKTVVGQGYSQNINVTVMNQASFEETFNVTCYYGNGSLTPEMWHVFWSFGDATLDGRINLADTDFMIANFNWNGPPGGNRADVTGSTPGVPDGVVNMRDIQWCILHQGREIWTYFLSGGVVGRAVNISLTAVSYVTFGVTWNTTGLALGNYSIGAYVEPVVNETDLDDNTLGDGWVTVTVPGDINADFIVDIYDAILLANAYNSQPSSPNWKANSDINSDNIVDIYDAIILANHYNQHYP